MVEIILFAIFGVPAALVVRALTKRGDSHEDESDVPGFWDGETEGQPDDGGWSHSAYSDNDDHYGGLWHLGLDSLGHPEPEITKQAVNPATGLPMISGDASGIDVMGNPFGFDLQQESYGRTGGFQSDGFESRGGDCWSGGSGGPIGGDDWS